MDIYNFRDIGGYQNQDGKVMKKNMIFRGGALNRIMREQAVGPCQGFRKSLFG